MTIISEDYGRFEVLRRDKVSGHIPQVDTLSIDRILEMFVTNEHITIYKAHHHRLILFELAEFNLKKMDVHANEYAWQELLKEEGSRLANVVYDMLRDCIEDDDTLKRTMLALTPQGKVVRATENVVIPDDMAFPSNMFLELAMGEFTDMAIFYDQVDTDDGAFIYTQEIVPHTAWASTLGVIAALAGYPYSLYMNKEPYNADFWVQARLQMPSIYSSLVKRQFSRTDDVHKALLASTSLKVVNHKEVANEHTTAASATSKGL